MKKLCILLVVFSVSLLAKSDFNAYAVSVTTAKADLMNKVDNVSKHTAPLIKRTPIVGTSKQVSFGIVLTKRPKHNVTISYHSDDESVAKPVKDTITFSPDNWYRMQFIKVDILDKTGSTDIVFDPTKSSDAHYHHKHIDTVAIVSHKIEIAKPIDKIVYSEFNISIPIDIAYMLETIGKILPLA